MLFFYYKKGGLLLDSKRMFVGKEVKEQLKQKKKADREVDSFLEKVSSAYIDCGQYHQKKLPLSKQVLEAFSTLDQSLRGSSEATDLMKSLKDLLPLKLKSAEKN